MSFSDLPLDVWELIFTKHCEDIEHKMLTFVNKECKSIINKNFPEFEVCVSDVCYRGYKNIFEWIRPNKGYFYGRMYCAMAAKGEHLELLKWLHENGFPMDCLTTTFAAEIGRLDILEWATQNGCSWDDDISCAAVKSGKLEVLQFLREKNCSWDEDTCNIAAEKGYLDILSWCIKNGCRYNDEKFIDRACAAGHLNILEWLYENWNAPYSREFFFGACIGEAASNGHIHILQWAIDNDIELESDLYSSAALYCKLDVIKFLLENECPIEDENDACECAVRNNNLETLKFLVENNFPFDITTITILAIDRKYYDILKWILETDLITLNNMKKMATHKKSILRWLSSLEK